jgi:hypothetical protein
MASTVACSMAGLPVWPESSTTLSSASDQAWARSQAVPSGLPRSRRSWISAPGIRARRCALVQELVVLQPGVVGEVVGTDADEGRQVPVRPVAVCAGVAERLVGDDGVLPGAPVDRGLGADRLVGAGEQAVVGGDQVPVAVGRGQRVTEGGPGARKEAADAAVEPVGLRGAGHGDAADDDPGVPLQADIGVGRVRQALAAAALVEDDDAVDVWVEVPGAAPASAAAGSAVDDEGGLAVRTAAGLPLKLTPSWAREIPAWLAPVGWTV